MRNFWSIAALIWACCIAGIQGKAVFAHFMLDNTKTFKSQDWASEISYAQQAKIDAFALNIAKGTSSDDAQLANAFAAANAVGFKLFFSFDYAGNGPWAKSDVLAMLAKYASNGAYYHYNGKPFVSTFEGPDNAADWSDIKSQTGCFFMPDWSSLGAKLALEQGKGIPDGLFNWAAWPWGLDEMNTYVDASYIQYLDGLPYMMPVSPWFYTNLPAYDKNWFWYSIDLWPLRWNEVLTVQPEFVEIITWNDFGESHYIGPQRSSPPFEVAADYIDYVSGIPHDGWRDPLPVWIDLYKTGTTTISQESLSVWFMKHHPQQCGTAGTTVNTASQLQIEFDLASNVYINIAYAAVLGSPADISITVGGTPVSSTNWTYIPSGNVGVYFGTTFAGDVSGAVVGTLRRNGQVIATVSGGEIGGCDSKGYANLNAWVGSAKSTQTISPVSPPHNVADMVCVEGYGAGDFNQICSLTCKYGYCPQSACICTKLGPQPKEPKITGDTGYSKGDPSFAGLCSWAYNHGYFFDDVCASTPQPTVIPKVSPFLPDACTEGKSRGDVNGVNIDGVCSFACNHGYCPIAFCTCTAQGPLNDLPAKTDTVGAASEALSNYAGINDMCKFICEYGYCPEGPCVDTSKVTTPWTDGIWANVPQDKRLANPTGDWLQINCSHGALSDALSSGHDQWASADANEAWAASLKFFEDYRKINPGVEGNGFQFSQIIAQSVDGTINRLCLNIPDKNCDTTVQCDSQLSGVAHGVSSPAGYMIINSMANIHNVIDGIDTALKAAAADVVGTSSEIATDFTAFSDQSSLKIGLDIFTTVFALVSTPLWDSWLKKLSNYDKYQNTAAVVQDTINAVVANGIAFTKDTLPGDEILNTAAQFSDIATNVAMHLRTVNNNTNTQLFSGEDTTYINDLMVNGASAGTQSASPFNIEMQFYATLVAMLIPLGWEASDAKYPVLLNATGLNQDGDACDPSSWDIGDFFDKSEYVELTFVCIDGTPYWLTQGTAKTCFHGGMTCSLTGGGGYDGSTSLINPLPGLDKLDGKHFGGLTKTQLATSAVNAYKAHGGNGWSPIDPSQKSALDDILKHGISAPGVFNVPICSVGEALQNLNLGPLEYSTFPCNKVS